jgi:hypothetical protein
MFKDDYERQQAALRAQTNAPAQPANAADALVQRIERGESIARDEVSPSVWGELAAGYKIDLPSTHALDASHIDMLATARAANVPQSVIDSYVREALKAGAALNE